MSILNVGDNVRMINGKLHKQLPEYYPEWGTKGTVTEVCDDGCCIRVRWPDESTSGDNEWYIPRRDVEVLPRTHTAE